MTTEERIRVLDIVDDTMLEYNRYFDIEFCPHEYDTYISIEKNRERVVDIVTNNSLSMKFRIGSKNKAYDKRELEGLNRQKFLNNSTYLIFTKYKRIINRMLVLSGDDYEVEKESSVIILAIAERLMIIPFFKENNNERKMDGDNKKRLLNFGFTFDTYEEIAKSMYDNSRKIDYRPILDSPGLDGISIGHVFIEFSIVKKSDNIGRLNKKKESKFRKFVNSFSGFLKNK